MKKAIISNRIYMSTDIDLRMSLDNELTYTIPPRLPGDPPEIIRNLKLIKNGLVSIPTGRTDLIPKEYEIIDKRITKPVELPEFKFDLRPSQYEVWDDIEDNAIINAWTSWGKTFTGLAIASKLGQKTLVIVHTVSLRNQWEKEIQKVFGIQPGIIGSGKFDIDAPIVIGNTQSLYRRVPKVAKEFGTLILDEMHHVAAPSFGKLVDSNYARYKIGLSATIQRKDGKHVVFRDYFGSKLYQPPKENYMVPSVDIYQPDIKFPDTASLPWQHKVGKLCADPEYQNLCALIASYYAAKGHKVLAVSNRIDFLEVCQQLTGDSSICILGGTPNREDLIEDVYNGEYNILYGTQQIFAEGISINNLSCLIMTTPINNDPLLTQLIGRVVREHPGKLDPKIVDIQLKGNTAKRQASGRMDHYIRQGYKVNLVKNFT